MTAISTNCTRVVPVKVNVLFFAIYSYLVVYKVGDPIEIVRSYMENGILPDVGEAVLNRLIHLLNHAGTQPIRCRQSRLPGAD